MSSKLSIFICQNCGSETSQYFGKCLNCNSWNSIVEEIKSKRSKHQDIRNNKQSIPFNEISSKKISRFTSGFREFDRVLGGGIVPGSVVLLGGEPGIGKSTIVLQSAGKISLNEKVLFTSACISTANGRVPSFVIVVVTPEIFSLFVKIELGFCICLLYTSPSPRDPE